MGYLSEKVWKGMIAFLCGKYIATGKAVYHFAMEDGLENKLRRFFREAEDLNGG